VNHLGERYTIEYEIGRGGMATVYRALDPRHGRSVAVKVLNRDVAASLGTERFLQEIQTVARLTHPHIVSVHDSGESDGSLYYVMPLIEGETLRGRMDRDRLSLSEVLRITQRVAGALDFAHRQGIVHRDIKPENVILLEGEPLILDFGIAKAISAAGGQGITQAGMTIGTPAYLSPEQASGELQLDGRSDQYSLACVVYEMIGGAPPFVANTAQGTIAKRFTEKPAQLPSRANAPTGMSNVLLRALSLDPAERYATVTEFALALANAGETSATTGNRRSSVAVLPFRNISSDAENEFFTDGITEEIILALTKVRALDVASRTSSFTFKGHTEDVVGIGQKLRVDTVLEGSVRKAGNRLRISAQLIDVTTNFPLWSERYDREMEDVFAVQDEIATNIVKALQLVLTEKEEAAIKKVATHNVRAYEYFLQARQFLHQHRAETMDAAEDLYRRAIGLDPDYALAYAGLADCACFRVYELNGGADALAQAEAASLRALALGPDLAEVRASRGLTHVYYGRFTEAFEELERAIELDPTLFEAAYYYARALQGNGEVDKAVIQYERAAELRPDDYQALVFAASCYRALGREADALVSSEKAVRAAERALALNSGESRALSLGASELYQLGDTTRAEEWARRAIQLEPKNPLMAYNMACMYSIMGQRETAIEHLTRAVELGMSSRTWLSTDPDLDPIRDDPRFIELLATLPPETAELTSSDH
jgi:serine/threonine protein kinase/tetratricopeptide (TPR) repeat protein